MRSWVLVECGVGRLKDVGAALREIREHPDPTHKGRILSTDTVMGPIDVIVQVEVDDLEVLGDVIKDLIQQVPGVIRTHTCAVLSLV